MCIKSSSGCAADICQRQAAEMLFQLGPACSYYNDLTPLPKFRVRKVEILLLRKSFWGVGVVLSELSFVKLILG